MSSPLTSESGCTADPTRKDCGQVGAWTYSRRIRKRQTDVAHLIVGGVSPPFWQFGFGKCRAARVAAAAAARSRQFQRENWSCRLIAIGPPRRMEGLCRDV